MPEEVAGDSAAGMVAGVDEVDVDGDEERVDSLAGIDRVRVYKALKCKCSKCIMIHKSYF